MIGEESAGGKDLPPDQPERIIGADGKSYAATTPKRTVWTKGRRKRNGGAANVTVLAVSLAGGSQVMAQVQTPHLTAGHQVS